MTVYDCVHNGKAFIVAKPLGHLWSQRELLEFQFEQIPLAPMAEDYLVEIAPDIDAWASQIDPALIGGD